MNATTPVGSTISPGCSENVQPASTEMDKNRHHIGVHAAQNATAGATATAQRRGRKTEAQRSTELAESLPKGIQIGHWADGRRKPFFVRFGKERRLESFFDEQSRNDRAEKLAEAMVEHGAATLDEIDSAEWRRWKDFRARCTAPLHELEALWAKHEAERKITCAIAAERYKALFKGTEPGYSHMVLHLKRLTDAYGVLPLADLSHQSLRELNDKLTNPKTGMPMSDVTKFDHRKNWNKFFARAVLERWIQYNPCDLFTLPTPVEKDRDVLSARQIFDLLKANREQPVIGRIAFELFGGLRASSAARLSPDHIKRDKKGIRLPGAEHKSGKTKFRQGHQTVLWEWYDHCAPNLWTVTKGTYDERKHEAFVRANIVNEGNVCRNSFATYMLALTNNPPLVARLMQHISLKMLEIYEGVATEEDAKLVMAMTPQAVLLSWEEFVKKAA